jgi:hypothetical protein
MCRPEQTYVVDSLPVAVCDNILRSAALEALSSARAWQGFSRLHSEQTSLLLRFAGASAEHRSRRAGAVLSGGSFRVGHRRLQGDELGTARRLDHLCRQKGYTDYHYEDLLEEVGLYLKAQRKKNSKREMPAWEEFLGKPIRQYIETVFSKL